MRVSVFGLGYVGSVTAACLARDGHEVVGVDVNPDKVASINDGCAPVREPGLGELVSQMARAGRLRATSSASEALGDSEIGLVCVGTPGRRNGALDVSALEAVSRELGEALRARRPPFTVVVRSTVLPGTVESVVRGQLLEGAGADAAARLRLAVNPEFMREGSSLADFSRPPFTLVGCEEPATAALLRTLYAEVAAPFVHTSLRTAEMVKYVANAFHALKVCFANEVADVCTAVGADAREVLRVFALDRKLSVSDAYLKPGFAFGGSCLPKDLRALAYVARAHDELPPLLHAILPSNEAQQRRGLDAVLALGKRRVGLVGLAFKPGTDDLRESPLVALAEALIGKGRELLVLDRDVALARLVGANQRYIAQQIPHIASLMCDTPEQLLAHAEVVVLGHAGPDAEAVLAGLGPEHSLVDLTRGALAAAAGAERPGAAA
ncbi:MAG: nucleotide sugar dehydrogenase [Vicinamibacteria bacterium]